MHYFENEIIVWRFSLSSTFKGIYFKVLIANI